jgi:hypothetical protein
MRMWVRVWLWLCVGAGICFIHILTLTLTWCRVHRFVQLYSQDIADKTSGH